MQPLTQIKPTEAPLFFVLDGDDEWHGVSNYAELVENTITGQFEKPTRFIEANPEEHWSADITARVAQDIADRTAAKGDKLDGYADRHLLTLIGQHVGVPAMLALEAA